MNKFLGRSWHAFQTEDGIFDATVAFSPPCPPYLNVDRDMMRNMASGPLQKKSTLKCGGAGGHLQSLRMTTNILSHITDCSVKNSTLGRFKPFAHWVADLNHVTSRARSEYAYVSWREQSRWLRHCCCELSAASIYGAFKAKLKTITKASPIGTLPLRVDGASSCFPLRTFHLRRRRASVRGFLWKTSGRRLEDVDTSQRIPWKTQIN